MTSETRSPPEYIVAIIALCFKFGVASKMCIRDRVMTAEYRPVEYGKDYDIVNNPDKFQLYIDGEEIE